MLDFTSALYLGMRHASDTLPPWAQLTTGVPAALAAPPAARALARELAALQGCERATLAPSTLHLFWDLFGLPGSNSTAIYMDERLYPVARWGVERAAARGATTQVFPHHDAARLRALLLRGSTWGRTWGRTRARPVIVTDGFCPGCGQPAPLADYLELARTFGGQLIMDDTQAIGIFGRAPRESAPYGSGGGGLLRWFDAAASNVLVVSSLAKSFGVPVAVLSGSSAVVRAFEAGSDTRVHCSPPSVAVLHATQHALALNRARGDDLRLHLSRRVRHFRRRLAEVGLSATGGLFPVQTLAGIRSGCAVVLHGKLHQLGVRAVLHRAHDGRGARLSFILTARHQLADIDRAVKALACALRTGGRRLPPLELEVTHEQSTYV